MRIIAGRWRGRRLRAPAGRRVRPTAERVREALFSAIADRVEGARVLDLFAGSGALGLEALSRGAVEAVFVERALTARTALARNVDSLGAGGACRVLARHALAALRELGAAGERFDVVLLDPPYASDLPERALADLAASGLLARAALVVVEHPVNRSFAGISDLRYRWTKRYGDTALTLFEAPEQTGRTGHGKELE